MKTIWKFPLDLSHEQAVTMRAGAEILCVQTQNNVPQLWALMADDERIEARRIQIRGTGHNADDVGKYIGTFQVDGGLYVFHVFDKGPM